ncbi:MAG: hypothetical protein LC775_10340, partial [Acidobacteria bacterium]|nr:hypothetical protein [Acidobacteriota bacterium]
VMTRSSVAFSKFRPAFPGGKTAQFGLAFNQIVRRHVALIVLKIVLEFVFVINGEGSVIEWAAMASRTHSTSVSVS